MSNSAGLQDFYRMRYWKTDLSLIALSLIWGSTFPMVKATLIHVPPLTLIAVRFLIAALSLGMIFRRELKKLNRAEALAGFLVGLSLTAVFALQTIGLRWTTSGKAGFITGLYMVIVPILSAVFLKQKLDKFELAGVAISFSGLGLLSLDSNWNFGTGDLWVLGCAFFCAVQIVLVAHYVTKFDAYRVATIQIMTTAVLSSGLAVALETTDIASWPAFTWGSLIFLGLIATGFCFVWQMKVQAHSPATRTALILGLEAFFAAVFGWIFADERMNSQQLIGCVVLVAGVLLVEMKKFIRLP